MNKVETSKEIEKVEHTIKSIEQMIYSFEVDDTLNADDFKRNISFVITLLESYRKSLHVQVK